MPSRTRETVTGAFNVANVRRDYTRPNCAAAWVGGASSTTYTGTVKTKVISDCTTPGFFRLRRMIGGILPNNPVEISEITETRTPCGPAIHSSAFVGGCYRAKSEGPSWSLQPALAVLPAVDNDLVNLVSQQSRAKCQAAIFDALTTVAEFGQTSRMVGNAWGRVFDYANRSARFATRFRRPGDVAKAFAEKWLEYRYGWMPAIYAAQDAVKAAAWRVASSEFISEKSSIVVPISETGTVTTVTPLGGTPPGFQTYSQTDTISGWRRYTGTSWGFARYTGPRSAGFDPLLTAWELVPYSFVVDWFLNVGTWIKSVSPFPTCKLSGGSCSVSEDYEYRQQWEITYSGGHSGNTGIISTVKKVRYYHRFGNTPGDHPVWNPRLTNQRYVDVFALVLNGDKRIREILNQDVRLRRHR